MFPAGEGDDSVPRSKETDMELILPKQSTRDCNRYARGGSNVGSGRGFTYVRSTKLIRSRGIKSDQSATRIALN
jgi:hypothetical protein